jgi:hypothetical protein
MASNKKVVVTCTRKYKRKDEDNLLVKGNNTFADLKHAEARFLNLLIKEVDDVLSKTVWKLDDLSIQPEDVYISFKIKAPEDEN